MRAACVGILIGVLLAVTAAGGCVRRTITIDSSPPGALVWLNDREVGRTPVDVDFVFYGEYDVRLEREGFEPKLTSGRTRLPVWDIAPLDFVAEVLPIHFHSRTRWHFELDDRDDDRDALVTRARDLRRNIPVPLDAADPADPADELEQ